MKFWVVSGIPLMDCRLGRMVTAPSAISSWFRMGEILEPQLSDPTQMKCPVWLAFFAARRRRLWDRGEEAALIIWCLFHSTGAVFSLINLVRGFVRVWRAHDSRIVSGTLAHSLAVTPSHIGPLLFALTSALSHTALPEKFRNTSGLRRMSDSS